ncbi:myosin-binding protein 1-like [Chenopodium quinoa]|uniref:myosin-binding protein 1-like n=1 Tax=Chenopodium quinoa TaxID=63459 RepID=UPI000B77D2AD|nr:myosin-binding protein 1-like [Chenopodium quinoa]XP_021764279.1 myosin-binding protein 1-like [Chenopodium quinoa]
MAVKGSFPIKVDSNVHGFTRVLKSAACEWLLLFLLLLDAAFSYSLTKFAQYCELQLPCILCSRLDHILGKENPDFYVNLLCNNHKSEISSLISCHNHGKLVDVHGMCEECLLSFAKNDSKEEAYKILVGKLGSECIQKPLVNLDINSGSLTTKFCSCCSKPWRSRPSVQKMVQSKLPSAPVSNPEIPSPKSPGHRCLNSQQGLKNRRDRFLLPTKPLVLGSRDHDSLSHVGYTEVKISSDSESDFPFSDDDDLINVPRNWKMNEFLSRQGSKFTPKSQYADVFPAVQRQKSTPATSNLMLLHLEPEKGETTTPRFISNSDLRKGLGELNWQQLIKKASPLVPELVSLDDIPLSSSAQKGSPAISADEGDRVSLSNMLDSSGYTDFISHKTALSSENVQLPARLSKENCIKTKEIGDTGLTSAMNNWESIDLDSTSTLSSRKDAALVPNNNSVIGARDLAPITIKDVKASNLLSEQIGSSACNVIESDEEVSKVSDPQTDSLSSNMCPPVNGHSDEPQKIQNPSSNDTLMPPKSPTSMERSQSLESLEESVSEIEGESLVDKLRRQVEYDKKCIKNLHKELDEERNASAIAANQAMAMITKLQEEKAALNMEALQYLRMMEEQAEYDVDALEKANEMIAEKDKEIQELEAELDYFRIKYPEDFPEMN